MVGPLRAHLTPLHGDTDFEALTSLVDTPRAIPRYFCRSEASWGVLRNQRAIDSGQSAERLRTGRHPGYRGQEPKAKPHGTRDRN